MKIMKIEMNDGIQTLKWTLMMNGILLIPPNVMRYHCSLCSVY